MKATELQIGDLVWLSDDICIKVEQITKNKVGYHAKSNESKMHYARLCDIEPIPITPEILEKNGFESVEFQFCVPEYCYSEIIDDKYTTVDVTVKENYTNPDFNWSLEIHNPKVFSGRGFINNIHELQHALRLSKIDKEIEL